MRYWASSAGARDRADRTPRTRRRAWTSDGWRHIAGQPRPGSMNAASTSKGLGAGETEGAGGGRGASVIGAGGGGRPAGRGVRGGGGTRGGGEYITIDINRT